MSKLHAFTVYAETELRDDNNNIVAVVKTKDATSARRLVACWNACADVDNKTLEQHPAPFSALRAERDQLLEVVKAYEVAHDSIFAQCASNPIRNAWDKEVDMSAFNTAHEKARRVL